MTQEITASFVWTADQLIAANENHWRGRCRPGYRAGISFLSVMAILGGWCDYAREGWSVSNVLFPLVGVYFLFLRKYDVRWTARRRFRKRLDKNLQILWKLSENALLMTTSESESRLNWSLISKVRKAHDGFLVYLDGTVFYWLPMTALTSEDDCRAAEALLRAKVKDFADIR
jgi:hypothetical protein